MLEKELFLMQDKAYKSFHSKLIPNISPEKIIGIRTPVLRKFASDFSKRKEAEKFLNTLPHKYYEENNLHACLIEKIKDYDRAVSETDKFLPYIDNWATCDMFMPPVFKKNKDALITHIDKWLKSDRTYTVRYALGLLMKLYLDEDFKTEYSDRAAGIVSEEYYINMMIAWYFATALAKQYTSAVRYLTDNRLPVWVHNKTIQKAVESGRIDKDTKEYLKTLKRRNK